MRSLINSLVSDSPGKPVMALSQRPVALITGAAKRIGAGIARTLHHHGYNVLVHYRSAEQEATDLVTALNHVRADSARMLQADLQETQAVAALAVAALNAWGRLDALINNASSYYPTTLGQTTEGEWDDLLGSNVKAPFFLSQALAPALRQQHGSIVNIVDVHAERPQKNYVVYCVAKAGLQMLTWALAKEMAPDVRVNGVAPGTIYCEGGPLPADDALMHPKIALQRQGVPDDIANTVLFLLTGAPYVTGQIIAVDGGRSLYR